MVPRQASDGGRLVSGATVAGGVGKVASLRELWQMTMFSEGPATKLTVHRVPRLPENQQKCLKAIRTPQVDA